MQYKAQKRQFARQCPRCGGFMPVKMLDPTTQNPVLKAVNGYCVRCRHSLTWIVIRGKRETYRPLYRTC